MTEFAWVHLLPLKLVPTIQKLSHNKVHQSLHRVHQILLISVATMVYTMITKHYKLQSSLGSTCIKLSSTSSSPFSTRHNKLQNSLGFTHIKLSSTNVNLQWWALLFWWTLVNSVQALVSFVMAQFIGWQTLVSIVISRFR